MVYVLILSMIAGALALYYYILKDYNLFKKRGIPHITPLPLLGNNARILFHRQSVADFIKEIYDEHPEAKYVGTYDMTRPTIMLRDLELIKLITLKHFDTFPDHCEFISEEQEPLFGKNLVSLVGDRWREVRAVLSPAFTSSKLKSMYKLMSTCGTNFANFLAQLPPERRVMEMKDVITRYTNDVIATCAFGVSVDSMRDPKNEFYMYGKEATVIFSSTSSLLKVYVYNYFPWLARMLRLRLIREEVANFFNDLIETTIKARKEKGIVRPDMLQLMMENRDKTKLSVQDMVAQAFIFFFGGFDSTSTLICFAIHEMAANRDMQERLQNEIDQVLESTDDGEASYEAINNMQYLDAVINEALRMYPVAVATDRLCVNDLELPPALPGIKPFTTRKGLGISIPIYALQHDPKYFDEPEKFDPDRFLGDRKKDTVNSGAYLPFGLGPRMCIGNRFALLETKVLLFHLLARCDLNVCEKTSLPMKLAKGGFDIKPEGGFWLSVVPRKKSIVVVADKNIVSEMGKQ